MTANDVQFSLIESALYLSVFGNPVLGNAVTEWVGILFREFDFFLIEFPLECNC